METVANFKMLLISSALLGVAGLLKSMLSERVLKKIVLVLLHRLAASSKNALTLELVQAVQDGLNSSQE